MRAHLATSLAFVCACTSIIGLPDLPDGSVTSEGGGDSNVVDGPKLDDVTNDGPDVADGGGGQTPSPVVIAQGVIGGLAVANGVLYFTKHEQPGTVLKCPVTGCASPTLFAGLQDYAYAITTDNTNVYWTRSNAGVWQCPQSNCVTPIQLATMSGAFGLAIDNTTAYWTTSMASGSIYKCAIGGCNDAATPIATGQSFPSTLTVDGTQVYWATSDGYIRACSIFSPCNTPTTIASGQTSASGVTSDSTYVYWANDAANGTIKQCIHGGCNNSPTTLASAQPGAFSIVSDGLNVYWSNQMGGTIMKCAVGGCKGTPTVLASNQFQPGQVVIDTTSVYWANNDGTIMRLTPR